LTEIGFSTSPVGRATLAACTRVACYTTHPTVHRAGRGAMSWGGSRIRVLAMDQTDRVTFLKVLAVGLVFVGVVGCGSDPEAVDSQPADTPATIEESSPAEDPAGAWDGVPGQQVEPSDGCNMAMKKAADEVDPSRAEPLIETTLTACTSSDEWLSSLAIYPAVMGMAEGHTPGLLDIQSACHKYKSAPVCEDAASQGVTLP